MLRTSPSRRLTTWVVLAILLVLVAAPLAAVLSTAVTGYRGEPSELDNLADPGMLRIIGNTVFLSVLVVVFATAMAAPLALLRSWTRFSRHAWMELVIMVPFMTPPFAAAMAWMDFTRVRGLATQWFGQSVGDAAHAFIYSVWGMAFIMAAELFPFLYLILRNCFDAIPASALEAAQVAGASRWRLARSIVAPLAAGPYSLGALIVFVRAAGEFGTPVTLGNAIGYHVLVSSIYEDVTIAPLNFSSAAASSSMLFSLGVIVWGIQQWLTRKDLTQGGRLSRRTRLTLAPWQTAFGWLSFGLVALLSVIIPYASITLAAMTILRSRPPSLYNLTFDYFGQALSHPSAQEALRTSALLAAVAATLTILLAVIIALASLRQRTGASRVLDFLAIAPDTVPGIVFAIGFILLWNNPALPWTPYGTMAILVLGYVALFLPSAVQNVKTSALALSPTLSDAAAMSGASRALTLATITLPLLGPGIVAGWLLSFLVGIRELVMSSLVRPTNINLLSPWIMNAFEQGDRAEAMAMTLIGVGSSTLVLVLVTGWQARRRHV